MSFYLAYGIGNLAQVMGSAVGIDEAAVRRVGNRIRAGMTHLQAWARRAGAQDVADLGNAGILRVEPDHDEALGLADVVEQLSEYLGSLHISFGVGTTPAEAWQALRAAAEAGEPYRLYDPEAPPDEEVDDIEAQLSKAEATDGAQTRDRIRAALQRVKSQAQDFEALKTQAPELYATVQELVMAMVAMANDAVRVQKSEELFKKLGLPMPKSTPKRIAYPPAEANPGSDAGPIDLKDKKKSQPQDPLTGMPLATKWHAVRSGKVVGKKGGVVPSREPNQD